MLLHSTAKFFKRNYFVRVFVTILKNSVPEKLPNNHCFFEVQPSNVKMSNEKQKNNISKVPKNHQAKIVRNNIVWLILWALVLTPGEQLCFNVTVAK
jgi:hypothetical protein